MALFLSSVSVHSQTTDTKNNKKEIKKLRLELEQIKNATEIKLNELQKIIELLQKQLEENKEEEELKKLLEEAENLTSKVKVASNTTSKKFTSGVRTQQALNPNISLLGEFFGGISTSKEENVNSSFYGNNNFYLRGMELNIDAPADPFTRGLMTVNFGEEGVEVELAYLKFLNMPMNSNIRLGKIRPEFGLYNKFHLHALPQMDKPRVLSNLFGAENLSGVGVASNFMLPAFISDANSLELSIMKGGDFHGLTGGHDHGEEETGEEDLDLHEMYGNVFSFTGESKYNIIYTGSLKSFFDVSESSYFELTMSGSLGDNDADGHKTILSALSFGYKWSPPERSKYRWFDLRSEIISSRYETPAGDINSIGYYVIFQNKMNNRFVLGGRAGYSELPFDNNQKEWDFNLNLDFFQSEYVMSRLQYQYNNRNFTETIMPDESSVFLQFIWALGPHKHTDY